MKTAFKLAFRNLMGAGLRTWLNVIVLSFSFVVIIWMKGILAGWDRQAKTDMEQWEIAKGQYWHQQYDPYDLFTFEESHAPIPDAFADRINQGEMVPVLLAQGSIYPQGRMLPVLIKGIPARQTLLKLPTIKLDTVTDAIPAIIGTGMAKSAHFDVGSRAVIRWRDSQGTFDAAEVEITAVFSTNVPAIDAGQIWIALDTLQDMLMLQDQATMFSFGGADGPSMVESFILKTRAELTAEIDEMIKTKSIGQSVFYIILLLLAMLAIFDTQVLSIFRRQKEIGTYIALGYTRGQVVGLFTIEGAMHAVLAAMVAGAYGIPFLLWQSHAGFTVPMDTSEFGMAISPTMYPVYGVGLVVSTMLIVMLTTAVVSYWPARRIAKMNPTEALRGKIQ